MRYNDLYEAQSFLTIASNIWTFAGNYTSDEKVYLSTRSREEPESWEGYLWRLIRTIKYDEVWSGYRDLADMMKRNVADHDKYLQIKKYLEASR